MLNELLPKKKAVLYGFNHGLKSLTLIETVCRSYEEKIKGLRKLFGKSQICSLS